MEMQVLRENVAIERLAGEAAEQTVVDGEVALPGGIRDEAHILHTDARLTLEDAHVSADRVTLDGTVVFQILYTQGDHTPRALEATSTFTHQMALPGVDSHMRIQSTGQVLEAKAQAVSGRLLLHAALSLGTRALEHEPVSVVTGVSGVPELQSKNCTVSLMQHAGQAHATTLLREEFDLPASMGVSETLYAVGYPYIKHITVENGSVIVSGDMGMDVYHTSQSDKPLVVTRHSVPFEQSLELGANEGDDVQAKVSLKDIAVSSVDAGEGARVLRAEAVLSMDASSSRVETVNALDDAYTLANEMLTLVHEPVTLVNSEVSTQSVQSGKLIFELPESAPPVRSVLAAFIEPLIAENHALGDRQSVNGILHSTVIYLPFGGDAPVSASQDTPFEALFQGALPANAWIQMDAQEVDAAAITSDRVELQYRLCMDADGYGQEASALPIDVKATAAVSGKGGVVVVYPKSGESLWDLARSYRVTPESIQKMNPNLKAPQAGKPVLIFKRQA